MGANNGPNKPKGNNPPRRNQNNNNNQRNNNKRSPLEQSARRNVNVSFQPGINSAYRGIDQANLDFQNQDLGVQSIYGNDLTKQLGNTSDRFDKATADIVPDLQFQQQNLMGALNQAGLPTSELAANTAVFGQQGNNDFSTLANDRNRMAGYGASAEREAGLSERYARQNLQQGLSDTQQQYYNRIADLQDQKAPAILAELERLREDRQADQESKAYSDMIASLVGNSLQGSNGPGRPGPGPGPGPNQNQQNGPGTVSWANIDNSGMGPQPGSDPSAGGNDNYNDQGQTNQLTPLAQQINRRVTNIGNAVDFADIPPWLQRLWRESPERDPKLADLQLGNFSPLRKQVFRRTQPEVRRLFQQAQMGGVA